KMGCTSAEYDGCATSSSGSPNAGSSSPEKSAQANGSAQQAIPRMILTADRIDRPHESYRDDASRRVEQLRAAAHARRRAQCGAQHTVRAHGAELEDRMIRLDRAVGTDHADVEPGPIAPRPEAGVRHDPRLVALPSDRQLGQRVPGAKVVPALAAIADGAVVHGEVGRAGREILGA